MYMHYMNVTVKVQEHCSLYCKIYNSKVKYLLPIAYNTT